VEKNGQDEQDQEISLAVHKRSRFLPDPVFHSADYTCRAIRVTPRIPAGIPDWILHLNTGRASRKRIFWFLYESRQVVKKKVIR
jgi:hypothetical protein